MFLRSVFIEDLDTLLRLNQDKSIKKKIRVFTNNNEKKIKVDNSMISNNSFALIENNEIKAYVLTSYKYNTINIFDVVCTNKVYLLPLILGFLYRIRERKVKLELTDKNESLIKKITSKISENFQMETEYNDKLNKHFLTFIVSRENLVFNDMKYHTLYSIYGKTDLNVKQNPILREQIKTFTIEDLERNKKFFLKHINKRNLDSLKRIGDKFNILYEHRVQSFVPKNLTNHLEKKEYKKIDLEYSYSKLYNYLELDKKCLISKEGRSNKVLWFDVKVVEPNFLKESLSSYRWYLKKFFSNYAVIRNKSISSVQLLDIWGYPLFYLSNKKNMNIYDLIPRNYSNLYDYYIDKLKFTKNVLDIGKEQYNLSFSTNNFSCQENKSYPLYAYSNSLRNIRRLINEDYALKLCHNFCTSATNPESHREIETLFIDFNRMTESLSETKWLWTPKTIKVLVEKYSIKEVNYLVYGIRDAISSMKKYKKETEEIRNFINKTIKKENKSIAVNNIFKKTIDHMIDIYRIELTKTLGEDSNHVISLLDRFKGYYKNIATLESLLTMTEYKYTDFNGIPYLLENIELLEVLLEKVLIKHEIDIFTEQGDISNTIFFFFSILKQMRNKIDVDTVLIFADKVCKEVKKKKKTMLFHDLSYPVETLLNNNLLEKETLKHMFENFNFKKINEIKESLILIKEDTTRYIGLDKIKGLINKCILQNRSFENLVTKIFEEVEKKFLRENNISEEDTTIYLNFINRMKKYDTHINIMSLIQEFGKNTRSIVFGQYKGLFEEKTIQHNEYKELGQLVKQCLGERGKGAIVKNPFKLYKVLSNIQNVKDIIEGKIHYHNIDKIVKELKIRSVKIPKKVFNKHHIYGKIESKCSPEFLIAGNASCCCMGFGTDKANDYALEEGFGIFNIYYKDRIIANSLIWINDAYNCFVVDNIEVHPNYEEYKSTIKDIYMSMLEYVVSRYNLDFAVQGNSYNDLFISNTKDKSIKNEIMKGRKIKTKNFYSDAEYFRLICIPNKENLTYEDIKEIVDTKNKEFGSQKSKHLDVE